MSLKCSNNLYSFYVWIVHSVQFSCSVMSDSLWPYRLQHTRLPGPCMTNSSSLLKLKSTELVMPSNHLILCCPLLFPPSIFLSIRVSYNESVLCIRWPKTGASASASVLPMNIQGWFPLGLAGLMSSLSKGFSRVFSSTTIWKHQFFGIPLSLWNDGLCLKY